MILVQTRDQFIAARSQLAQARVIAVDTETTGLWFHQNNQIIGISTYCLFPGDNKYALEFYFPFRHDPADKTLNLFTLSENLEVSWMRELRDVLLRKDLTLIFHNAKFDLKMLRKDGLDIQPGWVDKFYDTMAMARMVNENTVHSLKGLAELHFGPGARDEERKIKKLVAKLGGYHKTTPAQMAPYACKDAELTYKLCLILGEQLMQQGLLEKWPREERFLHVLKEMEWEGIEVDFDLSNRLSDSIRPRMRQLEDEIGFDPLKLDVLAHNLHAPPPEGLGLPYDPEMIAKTCTPEFPLGRPEMGEEILSKYPPHPLIDNVLEYRGLVKAEGTWYKGWRQKASPDQRIHPQYNSADKKEKYGTVTSRLSASYPNIQQMPRDPSALVKKCLLPSEGYRLIEFDYRQAELRLAACYAEDEAYYEAFRRGIDAHADTAEKVGISRQAAKHAAFTTIYGGAAPTLARTIERLEWQERKRRMVFDEAEARAILDAYFSLHPKFKKMPKIAEATARSQGYVQLWNGIRRHFEYDKPHLFRKAFNSVIQGGIAQLVQDTMLRVADEPRPYRMALQVHDSIWFEVPIEDEDVHCKEIKTIMEWPSEKFAVPFPVDMKVMRDRHERIDVLSS